MQKPSEQISKNTEMEQNLPIITKKIWKIIRVVYLMLRRGISKGKLLADIVTLMKRGKIAGKAAIQNLMFHHHHHHAAESRCSFPVGGPPNEYEFSCSNSPIIFGAHFMNKRKSSGEAAPPFDCAAAAAALDIFKSAAASPAALEIFKSAAASPVLPGFGPSPLVRQLRITDSPFPIGNFEEDNHVDKAAEEFIVRFYRNLKKQNSMA
ncbi:hypothetical protein OROHE_005827 [Orobanche hederae]